MRRATFYLTMILFLAAVIGTGVFAVYGFVNK